MKFPCLLTITALFLVGCQAEEPAQAREPDNFVPVRIADAQIQNSLKGWTKAPAPHAANRIVLKSRGFKDARALTVENTTLDFDRAVTEALSKEGITNISLLTQRDVQEAIAHDFRLVTGIKKGTFRSWIAKGTGPKGEYKIAGFSLISPLGNDPGTSFEMFLAPKREYEALGGFIVPSVRYLDNVITKPPATLREWGAMSDAQAIKEMDAHFAYFMTQIIRGRILQGMMQQQTLGMLQGLGPNGDYGLNDPIYDF